MNERAKPREHLHTLAASLKLGLDDLLGDLLTDSAPAAPPTAGTAKPIPLSDAAIRVAISESYSTSEIALSPDEHHLLDQSQVVMIGGRRRLRLSDEARGAILREASGSERYTTLLREAITIDNDPASVKDEIAARSACLRRFLGGTPNDLKPSSTTELRAAVAALERLRRAPGPTPPRSPRRSAW